MTRLSSSFVRERELIIVRAEIAGPATTTAARLILDTGAAATTLVPEVIERIGYTFPLGHQDIDGLVGMNFLRHFNFEVRPAEQRILVELINPLFAH